LIGCDPTHIGDMKAFTGPSSFLPIHRPARPATGFSVFTCASLAPASSARQMRERCQALLSNDSASPVSAPETAASSPSRASAIQEPGSHARWLALGPAEKIERPLCMSLDRCYEILSWPPCEIDSHRLNVRVQVWRVVFMIGVNALRWQARQRSGPRTRPRAHDRKSRTRVPPRDTAHR
jgi:hypothetical protein